jgi:hypothetical protein
MIDEAALQTAFNAVIAGRGEVSSFHADIARMIAQLMLSSKTVADAGQLTALASDVAKLEALLPPISAADDDFDIRRLTDDELLQLERLQCKACDQTIPVWAIEQEPLTEPPISARERCARNLALWIDDGRGEAWRFGGCSPAEALHLRNELSSIVSPLVCRHLWRDIFLADMQTEIEYAVRKALAAVGSDAQITPATPEERAQIAPPEEQPNNGSLLGHYPPFTFGPKND